MPKRSKSKPETTPGQWLLYGVFVVAAISLYLLISASLRNRTHLEESRGGHRELKAEVGELEAQNIALREHIRDFHENPEFEAERRMRTEFKWARENEWIYLIDRGASVHMVGFPLERQILEFEAESD